MENSLLALEKAVPLAFKDDEWTFIDCGAYLGDFTDEVIQKFKPANVIIIEANPALAAKLSNRFTESSTAITLENVALSTQNEIVNFYVYDDLATSSLLQDRTSEGKVIQIRSKTLSSVINSAMAPVFLKTDLQGLDYLVLQESKEELKQKVKIIICEFIQYPLYKNQGSPFEIFAGMEEIGFELFQITDLHSKEFGNLAFGNFIFIKKELAQKIVAISEPDKMISNELKSHFVLTLKEAAEERLALINRLDKELRFRAQTAWQTKNIFLSCFNYIKNSLVKIYKKMGE